MTTLSFQTVIGLEIHAQIASETKLFSSASSQVFGYEPNTRTSFVDLAFPGMLPVVNRECVLQAARLGLAVGGTINLHSVFERKHYFYPDNPSGYQISQYRTPLVEGGALVVTLPNTPSKVIRLQRIHIEQDAGQSIHDQDPTFSLVNFNRAGIGLMEIVSHPDLTSPEEVVEYVKKLRSLMRYLKVCYGDMEKGQLRVDANVSLHLPGEPLGTRVEIKNINSFRFLQQALNYEIQRQTDCLTSGQAIVQETRGFDPARGLTYSMRNKEHDYDYWYFPDPDLLPLALTDQEVDTLRDHLPELPWDKCDRFQKEYGLSPYDAALLTEDYETASYFEKVVHDLHSPDLYKSAANWMLGELFAYLNQEKKSLSECPITPEDLKELLVHLSEKRLSHPLAKEVFGVMWTTGKNPSTIMTEKNLVQVTDSTQINEWIQTVLDRESEQVQHYREGKIKVFGYLVGQVMKESKGKGNPQIIQELLTKALS
jgi:aspartyl-tRNA(Asn)/glutamyl-tRNA(Gln) amidotransferase subunit B